MGIEIERKFLVKQSEWQTLRKEEGQLFRQGYILIDPKKTIRVRLTKEKGFLTIKGISVGATRAEYEYEIPTLDATELLNNFAISELSKIRYKINYQGKNWEVDEFLGDNEGLVIAEIELSQVDEKFDIPEWVDKEVTEDKNYYNSNLTVNPFKKWAY